MDESVGEMSAGGFDPSVRAPVALAPSATYDPLRDPHSPYDSYYDDGYGRSRYYRLSLFDVVAFEVVVAAFAAFFSAISRLFGAIFGNASDWEGSGASFRDPARLAGGGVRQLRELQKRDVAWSEEALLAGARASFVNVQNAWSGSDLAALQRGLMPALFQQWRHRLEEDRLRCMRNLISDVKVLGVELTEFEDFADNDRDRFRVRIVAQAWDRVVTFSGNVVLESHGAFAQVWTFRRQGREFRLESVTSESPAARRVA